MLGVSYFFDNFKTKIENTITDSIVILPEENNFLYSTLGTQVCGDKLVKSVYTTLKVYQNAETISFIGHSFGGILTRYVIGVLQRDGFFEKIKPLLYASISTPHAGVITDKSIIKFCLKHITGITGKELICELSTLEMLSQKNSDYLLGLEKFTLKLLYGNLFNDDVIAQTACLYNLDCSQELLEIVPKRLFLIVEHTNASNNAIIITNDPFIEIKKMDWIRKVADFSEYLNSHTTIVGRHTFIPFFKIQSSEASIVIHDIICEMSKKLNI
jgi:hypothetical protein